MKKQDEAALKRVVQRFKIVFIGVAVLALPCYCHAATCSFNSGPTTLNFGSLDPGTGADVTITGTVTFRCIGAGPFPTFFTITDDDGRYETGTNANRMRNTAVLTEFLPYTFSLVPPTGGVNRNVTTTVTLTGAVRGVDYRNAYVGNYSDTVTLTIVP